MSILEKDIKMYNEISDVKFLPTAFELPKSPFEYTKLHFFNNWIVGFTCSEGSFFIKSNNDGCFILKQRIHLNLFEAFKLIYTTNRKIESANNYVQFSISSKADVQKVINLFSFYGLHPLIGYKYIQYIKWLNNLRVSSRYNKLNYPDSK